jgi:hypothetical protein
MNKKLYQNFKSWVDIHDIYYIVKNIIHIWWFVFLIKNILFLIRMMQDWTETITTKIRDDWEFKKLYTKDIINGYVYV